LDCIQSQNDPNFIDNFKNDISQSVSPIISESRITVEKVTCGSTVVMFTILPPSQPADPSARSVLNQLQAQLDIIGSPLLTALLTSSSYPNQTLPATIDQLIRCTDGTIVSNPNQCSSGQGQSMTFTQKLIFGLALGCGIPCTIIIAIIFCLLRKRHYSQNDHVHGIPAKANALPNPQKNVVKQEQIHPVSKTIPGSNDQIKDQESCQDVIDWEPPSPPKYWYNQNCQIYNIGNRTIQIPPPVVKETV